MPRLRATSISSLVSSVNVTRPSTSAGRRPASSSAALHRFARELELAATRLLGELGLADAGDRGPVRQPAGHAPAPRTGRPSTAVPVTCSPSSFTARELDLDDASSPSTSDVAVTAPVYVSV